MCNEHTELGLTDKNAGCACGTHDHSQAKSNGNAGCACGTHDHSQAKSNGNAAATATIPGEYFVTGMTCSHCVASVTEELGAVDGVDKVSVELNVGGLSKVTVQSSRTLDDEVVRAAVEEAGYAVAQQ